MPPSALVDRAADELAKRRSRRGFLGLTAKVTAAVAGTVLGFAGFATEARGWTWHCCNFSDQCTSCGFCPTCPNCPSGTVNVYTWQCCDNGCQYTCKDCTQRTGGDCACGSYDGIGGCGGPCPNSPIRK